MSVPCTNTSVRWEGGKSPESPRCVREANGELTPASTPCKPEPNNARVGVATPDKRARRKSMSRRSGQSGYVEKKGNAFYVRFRIDVQGQENRAYTSVRICPVSGPGSMTKS